MSHFLPHQALLPEKRFLTFPPLAKAVGSAPLAARLARLRPAAHVFGHSHFAWDAVLPDGARYVQAPLCYPSERARRGKSVRVGALAAAWRRRQEADAAAAAAAAAVAAAGAGGGEGAAAAAAAAAAVRTRDAEAAAELPVLLYVARYNKSSGGGGGGGGGGGTGSGGDAIQGWAAEWSPSIEGAWSEYYLANARRPWDTALAPWVAPRFERRRRRLEEAAGGGGEGRGGREGEAPSPSGTETEAA